MAALLQHVEDKDSAGFAVGAVGYHDPEHMLAGRCFGADHGNAVHGLERLHTTREVDIRAAQIDQVERIRPDGAAAMRLKFELKRERGGHARFGRDEDDAGPARETAGDDSVVGCRWRRQLRFLGLDQHGARFRAVAAQREHKQAAAEEQGSHLKSPRLSPPNQE